MVKLRTCAYYVSASARKTVNNLARPNKICMYITWTSKLSLTAVGSKLVYQARY